MIVELNGQLLLSSFSVLAVCAPVWYVRFFGLFGYRSAYVGWLNFLPLSTEISFIIVSMQWHCLLFPAANTLPVDLVEQTPAIVVHFGTASPTAGGAAVLCALRVMCHAMQSKIETFSTPNDNDCRQSRAA